MYQNLFAYSRLGYGIQGIDRAHTSSELCSQGNGDDDFTKEDETVFQLQMKALSIPIHVKAKPWNNYLDMDDADAGFICEKEGNLS